jgi:YVTN family beta-propeller protein
VIRAALLAAVLLAVPAAAPPGLTGARSTGICAAAGPFWPTMVAAADGRALWVACKEQGRLLRIDSASGRVLRRVTVPAQPIAVAVGFGSLWAVDAAGTVLRLDRATGRPRGRVDAGGRLFNVWIGAGSVWTADDAAGAVVRIDPRTNRVAARIPVGDGPSDLAFAGSTAYVINHRDQRLMRVEGDAAAEVVDLGGDAPERLELAGGSLWVTGRGTDLLEVDPASGAVRRTVEIGASGVDVVAARGALWVPVRTAAADVRGFPTIARVVRVDARTGAVRSVSTARGRVDVHGLAADGRFVWVADTTAGRLHRLPAR